MTTLAEQLRGFHAAVTGAAPLESARALIDEDAAADGLARLHVYAHAYTARIAGVLAQDYPKLEAVRGSLRELTAAYLRAYPPGHPSLREAGLHVARFLADRGEPAHLVELARLERARVEVFDGADAPPLGRADVEALGPEDFPGFRLALVPAHRLVELATSADDLWDAVEAERELPPPVDRRGTVLVWRRDVTVIHRTLEPDEARVMGALAAGTSFADACELLGGSPERALELLVRWLDAGILRRT